MRPLRIVVPVLLVSVLAAPALAASSSRLLPARGLTAYLEYDGVDAKLDAWKATSAYAILRKTPAGSMVSDISRQVIDRLFSYMPGTKLNGADVIALQDHLLRRGFTLAVYDDGKETSSTVLVLNGFGVKETRDRFDRMLLVSSDPAHPAKPPKATRARGRDLYCLDVAPRPADGPTWWFEGDDLIVVVGPDSPTPAAVIEADDEPKPKAPAPAPAPSPLLLDGRRVAAVLDTIEGKTPNASTHPGREAALGEGKDIVGFESNGLFFIESAKAAGGLLGLPASLTPSPIRGLEIPSGLKIKNDPAVSEVASAVAPAVASAVAPAVAPAPVSAPSVVPVAPASAPRIAPLSVSPAAAPRLRLEAAPASPDEPRSVHPTGPKPDVVKPDKPEKPAPDPLVVLGLDRMKRVTGRWGFQGKGLLTTIRVEAPAPRTGVLALLDQPGFRKDDLPPVPRDSGIMVAGSFDPSKSFDRSLAMIKAAEPDAAVAIDAGIKTLEQVVSDATGLRFRDDILKHLGPTWCVYVPADAKTVKGVPESAVLVIGVDDSPAFAKVLDRLVDRLNTLLNEAGRDPKHPEDLPVLAIDRLPAPDRGYRLTSPAGLVPWLDESMQPTIMLGKSHLVVATNPTLARAAIAAESRKDASLLPVGELAESFKCLPAHLTSVSIGDPSVSAWPGTLANLPSTVQILVGALDLAGADAEVSPGEGLLTLVGIPRRGGFRVRIDPAKVPKADAIEAMLFPSVLATAVDDRGLRLIVREAMPFACIPLDASVKKSTGWSPAKGVDLNSLLKLKLGLGG